MIKLYNILQEAKIVPVGLSNIPSSFYQRFDNIFYKNLIDYIEHYANFGFKNNKDISTFLFENNNAVITEYLKKRILQSEVEILRNGEVELVDSSNIDTLSEDELLEYLNEDKEAQRIISKLFWKYYFKYLDVPEIRKECLNYTLKEAVSSSQASGINDFFKNYYSYFGAWSPQFNMYVGNNIIKYFEDYDTIPYPEDMLDNNFENYLSNSLSVQDIDEAKVVPATFSYKYKIGDTVQEMYGNERLAKVINIRPNFNEVIENPIATNYMPIGVEYDGDLYNNPWYLLQWLGPDINENNKTWWPEEEIQIPVEDEDIDEAKVVPASIHSLLPMLTSDSTEESHSIDYNNIAKNIKRFKSLIAAKLKSYSLDKDTLDRFLINYANGYIEVDHAGEAYQALHNITLQEWLDDIEAAFKYMYEEDEEMEYEPDPIYDKLTIDDIR